MNSMEIRKATAADVPAIAEIYSRIHTEEEADRVTIGWQRAIYPTEQTALAGVEAQEMFVLTLDGEVAASARINHMQMDAYAEADWEYPAPDDKVMVLHTLTVDPEKAGRGIGKRFVAFYEDFARQAGCPFLRMDTNAINVNARNLYRKLGYREIGIVPCVFNGLTGVNLVCLEKKLPENG